MKIVGVDPGMTTGIAFVDTGTVVPRNVEQLLTSDVFWESHEVRIPQLSGPWSLKLAEHIHAFRPDLVAIENFRLRPTGSRSGAVEALSPLYLAAAIEMYMAEHAPNVCVYKYMPADAKVRWSNERLKKMGWYKRGSDHERDAVRQALMGLLGQMQLRK